MKFGQAFEYNGTNSKDLGLILVGDGSDDEYALGLERETITGNSTQVRHEVFTIASKYTGNLTLTLMLVKDPCTYDTQEKQAFTRAELREITAWLTSPNVAQLLTFEDYDNDLYNVSGGESAPDFFGTFTDVTSYAFGNLYGVKAIFQCSSPWGYTKEQVYTTANNGSNTFIINNTSDDWESYVYPEIILTSTENETVTITNSTEGGSFSLVTERNVDTYIDCQRLMVRKPIENGYDIITFSDLGWTTDTLDTLYWPRLIHGSNTITVTGSCDVTIKCRFPRKVGEF